MRVEDNVFSVSEINLHLKNVLENNIPSLMIQGEVANFKHHSSGHIYFSLKDAVSSIRCVFFRSQNKSLNFKPKNGDSIICSGKITVYERAGNYQIMVNRMYPEGTGLLQIKFEELKKKLASEGLFDATQKKQLPEYPEKIGIITSETGAALQDIKNVLQRRFPVKILLYPSLVQGVNAPQTIIDGINYFNNNPVDLIILTRGGGSQEDLFCFNDEALAYAIYKSKIPIISGVGHEIDFSIADFVADLRAPTPSAAAELAVPDKLETINLMNEKFANIRYLLIEKVNSYKNEINQLDKILIQKHPRNQLFKISSQLQNFCTKLLHSSEIILLKQQEVKYLKKNLITASENAFTYKKDKLQYRLQSISEKMQQTVLIKVSKVDEKVNSINSVLQELSPYKALRRGYSILRKEKKIKKSVQGLRKDDIVDILLTDGELNCRIMDIKKK